MIKFFWEFLKSLCCFVNKTKAGLSNRKTEFKLGNNFLNALSLDFLKAANSKIQTLMSKRMQKIIAEGHDSPPN